MTAFRCPWKGEIDHGESIMVGKDLTDVRLFKLRHNGSAYIWYIYDSGAGWITGTTPTTIYNTLHDPVERYGRSKFKVPLYGLSGSSAPSWPTTIFDDDDPPLFDGDLAWRVVGQPTTNTWTANTLYQVGDLIEISSTPVLAAQVEGYWDTCVRSECRLWDSSVHECGGAPNLGGGGGGDGVPAMAALVSEYMGNEDLDGNGLVYGIDFKITDDTDKPAALKGLEEDPNWEDPSSEMTWPDYLASL